ncbi:phage tail tube protein [Micromonospora aurantiaca (nom. illeg.)]|uniref:phage tail tube protein n=1 Tax=Micromonospora aurantiaca (nom. illeg.) TaxID=47850 RepID=UPI0033CFA187
MRSGLCAQLGFKAETTPGTAVTVDRFLPVNSFTPTLAKSEVVAEGVRGCATTPYTDDSVVVGRAATAQMNVDVRSKAFGPLLRQILGAVSGPTVVTAPIYRQIHTPGDVTGKSLTFQVGLPESYSSTINPFTYRGGKVTNATFSCARGGTLKLALDLDFWDEDTATALAVDTYPTGWEIFSWAGFTATIGGTASTATGRTTIAGGTAIKGLRGISLPFALGLATDRVFAGAGGIKAEQIENAMRSYTGELDVEFADRAQLHTLFSAHTTTALQFTFTGKVDLGTGQFPVLRITYPQTKLLTGSPGLSGPDIIPGNTSFRAYADPAETHPAVQIEYESADATL